MSKRLGTCPHCGIHSLGSYLHSSWNSLDLLGVNATFRCNVCLAGLTLQVEWDVAYELLRELPSSFRSRVVGYRPWLWARSAGVILGVSTLKARHRQVLDCWSLLLHSPITISEMESNELVGLLALLSAILSTSIRPIPGVITWDDILPGWTGDTSIASGQPLAS
jgi:hypothetical protein